MEKLNKYNDFLESDKISKREFTETTKTINDKINKTRIFLENLSSENLSEHNAINSSLSRIKDLLDNKIGLDKYNLLSERVNGLVSIEHLFALEARLKPMLNDAFDKCQSITKDHRHITCAMQRYDEMIMDKAYT